MPELPEVETLCRQLQTKIKGKKILATQIYDDKLRAVKNVQGRTVTDVERQGKRIVIGLDDGRAIFIHLRMTGRLLWQKDAEKPTHGRYRMTFADGNVFLDDPRRFATVEVSQKKDADTTKDIFKSFDLKYFLDNHACRKTSVKTLVMDKNAVEGIGNIYACEILHRIGINPERPAAKLTKADWSKFFKEAKVVLDKSITKRGTSISDWRDLYGEKGENQHELKAYGQEGKACSKCGGTIRRIKQGGRSTFYCPKCQM
jgi:formamidopyrimidine-DNA glycosylase